MTEPTDSAPDAALENIRARADTAERALAALQADTEARLVRAELKAEAVRAGIVDLDGLKLLDLSAARLNDKGEVEGAATLLATLKREKPWLFAPHSSSSTAAPPPAAPAKTKMATEMSDAEYRAARAALLKRR